MRRSEGLLHEYDMRDLPRRSYSQSRASILQSSRKWTVECDIPIGPPTYNIDDRTPQGICHLVFSVTATWVMALMTCRDR